MRENTVVGTIAVRRTEARPFSDTQVNLLKTFADQAVIAIENVRLFTELQASNRDLTEALTQQTATSEVLKVISRSTFDLQPVLQTLIENATRLCGAQQGFIFRADGDLYRLVVDYNAPPAFREWARRHGIRPGDGAVVGRVALENRVVQILDAQADAEWRARNADAPGISGVRTLLGVPMRREGTLVGVIAMWRTEVLPFTGKQLELIETFADQAVIAVENVRLFTELQTRNGQLTEALEQQTATAEILGVISQSPTNLQRVLDTVVQSAARLCEAYSATLILVDGDVFHIAANYGTLETSRPEDPVPVTRGSVAGRSIIDRQPIHVLDLANADEAEFPLGRVLAARFGHRTTLAAPLLREGTSLGTIVIRRREVRAFSDRQITLLQTFADQAVIAIENVRLFTELQEKNRALTQVHAQVTESLEQQTATSEILRVIASSPTDVQPVLEAVAETAARLCGAADAHIWRVDGDILQPTASYGGNPIALEPRRALDRESVPSRAVLERQPIHVEDLAAVVDTEYPAHREAQRRTGTRSVLAIPLMREGLGIGAIVIRRTDVRPFTDKQIALLQTFTDQAAIAIENVRLFTETREALERQMATSEILRVISSSPTDVQPVFDAVAASGARLCDAIDAAIFRVDGDALRLVAHQGAIPAHAPLQGPPLVRGTPPGRAVLDGRTIHFTYGQGEDDEYPEGSEIARRFGHRTVLCVPLLRAGQAIGVIAVRRTEARPFTDRQVELLKTFADQAVIAIENVRLFKELEVRNRDLTEALDRQTATAEVLRVISQAQTELQPVFEAIVDHAMRLFRAWAASVLQIDGQLVRLVASRGGLPGSEQQLREQSPWPIDTPSPVGFCIADRTIVHIPDIEADRTVDEGIRALGRTRGWRSILAAPIMRDGQPIGAISIQRAEAGPFSPAEIDLLKTFADQAVIAIENTRLLGELQARTGQLTRSVEELTALGDVSRALSSTLDLDTVLQTIVTRASQLTGTDVCSVFEYDEAAGAFYLRATHNLDEEVVTLARQTPIRKGEGVQGRMAVTRQPVQVPDIAQEQAYRGPLRDVLLRIGTRAVLAVPMLRENELIGGLTVAKKTAGEFSREIIELLKTFATQSALAIQNARLFRELAAKSHQLEEASQHKSEFLANMSHELRTPLNAVIGFSEVLSERMFGELNEKQEEYLKDIHASGQHLLSLINDILDLSKIEAGKMELELSDFDLPMTIDNALMLVRERAARRSIDLHRTVDERLGQVQADERKVRQVLLNLLSNAIKFTPDRGRIDVQARAMDSSVEVLVRDTGVGIAPEDQQAIFEEFRQVGTAAKKVEGTGLGLTLSRKFVELHGGRIWVESQLGTGSTFTFTLPVRREG
jgi:GAF domain-containing protein